LVPTGSALVPPKNKTQEQEPLSAQPYGGELGDIGAGKGSSLSVSLYLTGAARPVCVRKALGPLDLRLLVSYRGAQLWLRLLATAASVGGEHYPRRDGPRVFTLDPDHVGIETFDDPAGQIAWSHHWIEADGRLVRHSAPYRYVWPSELDLMARIAGFRLRDRWAGWDRVPFTSASQSQVAVFEKRP
jgi:hypothetical protein